ncbi:hypothetical protein SAY87_017570 [Trapa incisa]|uniref:Transcription factor ILR3 n=1 Tax=Trapa incisa TaxID=236973 RepID=A0AAN7L6R8_9MYRT|nr:hypothetical protein SAY87_017570 [Trapa incisa]
MRRDRLNERHAFLPFLELSSILEPGKPPKPDKAFVLGDALRTVIQLRTEKEELKELNGQLQEKIKELKAEKNELKDEKQRLKEDKEKLEQQVKAMAAGHKLIPYIGFPGVAMWQFMSPAVVDTSQDHVLRPPVA